MTDIKAVMIANAIIKSVGFICVTAAAIWFGDPVLLWWYLLPALCGEE